MLKILGAEQIRQLDAATISNEPIASIDLMERASQAFVSWLMRRVDAVDVVGIVCGTGNNGGDGLAIARLLLDWNYNVKVWIVRGSVKEAKDFSMNLQRLSGKTEIAEIISQSDTGLFTECDVIVDAVFGSGLSRPVEGIYAQVIDCINRSSALRVAVDVPSGLPCDGLPLGNCVKADYTITFQLPKLSFFMPSCNEFVGEWQVVKIGLDKNFIESAVSDYFYTEKKDIRKIIVPRKRFDHKGTFGKALIIAGSKGKLGASVLCARAAFRSGLGLLTVHTPACGYSILQTSIPEAMVSTDAADDFFSSLPELTGYTAVGVGPGIGQHIATKKALTQLLQASKQPLVLDADAINLLASNSELIQLLPANSILSPHPGEFERLVGHWNSDFERLQKQRDFSRRTKTIVILKGAYTSITSADAKVFFNPTGNPGMATAGSGDVLTGILTGLLAQGYSALDAAILGVYVHGLAGDKAAHELGQLSMMAGDIIAYLPTAWKELQ